MRPLEIDALIGVWDIERPAWCVRQQGWAVIGPMRRFIAALVTGESFL